jgi:class 3 adenylate cyclase
MNCSNCQTELPAGARFCMNCGQPVESMTEVDEERRQRLASAAPPMLVEKAQAANRLSGERRIVTALYLDVVGSRALIQKLGQAAAEEIIFAGLDLACPIIYRYEGTIAQLQEDEMLVFFGAPVAHEDDPVRAVRAALEMLDSIRLYAQQVKTEHQVDFAMRISLSTGPVSIGLVDAHLKYEYTALGGTLNLAAQLEATKQEMSILVSESTHRFIAPFFECRDLGYVYKMAAEDKESEKIHIYEVLGLRATPGEVRGLVGLESPMVGRARELATLVQLSRAVQAGLGRAVLIQGEPGLGKTRLLREWKNTVENSQPRPKIRWIEGRCTSYSQENAYSLVSSLLHAMCGVPVTASEAEMRVALIELLESVLPGPDTLLDVYPYLGQVLNLKLEGEALERVRQLDPQAHLAQGQAALRRLLVAMAARQPLVIVLEDLHWADPTSVAFLSPLIALAGTEPILFCLVMRVERESAGRRLVVAGREALGSRLSNITMEALNTTESRQLVSNLLAIEALPESIRDLILQRAEGNPFFVEEVIRMLIDRQAIVQVNGRWQAGVNIYNIDIPDNLQGLLLARIDRLPEEVKETLRVAAVIGRQFPLKVLEHILNRQAEIEPGQEMP